LQATEGAGGSSLPRLLTLACASVDGGQVIGSIVKDRILESYAPPVSRGQPEPVAVAEAAAERQPVAAAAVPAVSIPRAAPLESRRQAARHYATA